MIGRVIATLLLISMPLFAAEDFYEQQLRAGKADVQANRLTQAADEFRIAAFGVMQRPELLEEALARLAVVQSSLGQTTDMAKTIDRFVDVEQHFAPYATVQLEPAVKTKLEELVAKQVPRATLQAIPSLARLANYEVQRIAVLPASERLAAYRSGAEREPNNPEWSIALTKEAATRDDADDVIKWGTKALELDPKNAEVRPLLVHARSTRRECKEALAISRDIDLQQHPEVYADQAVCFAELSQWKEAETALANVPQKLRSRADVKRVAQLITAESEKSAKRNATPQTSVAQTRGAAAVPQTSSAAPKVSKAAVDVIEASRKLIKDGKYEDAVRLLRPAVQNEPDNRSLKLALLEASVLARDWRTAASQVPVVTPLSPGEELYMFYASVALYETGRHDEAKLFMEKARPRMVPSPMVDYYVKTILGQQRGS